LLAKIDISMNDAEEKMIFWKMEEMTSVLKDFLIWRDKLKNSFTTRR